MLSKEERDFIKQIKDFMDGTTDKNTLHIGTYVHPEQHRCHIERGIAVDTDSPEDESGSLSIDVTGPGSHEFINELSDFIRTLASEFDGLKILDLSINISNVQ